MAESSDRFRKRPGSDDVHPDAPAGGSGSGFSRSPGAGRDLWDKFGLPHPDSPNGRTFPWSLKLPEIKLQQRVREALQRIDSAASTTELGHGARIILGPKSFELGVCYGLMQNAGETAGTLLDLARMFVLAGLDDAARLPVWSCSGPLLMLRVEAEFAELLFGGELKKAHDERDQLLTELLKAVKNPLELIGKAAKRAAGEYAARWRQFQDLMSRDSLAGNFEAGIIVGNVLFDVIMLLATVGDVIKAAKFVAEIPTLTRLAKSFSTMTRGGVSLAEEGAEASRVARAAEDSKALASEAKSTSAAKSAAEKPPQPEVKTSGAKETPTTEVGTEKKPPNNECQSLCGEPINSITGEMVIWKTDLVLPGVFPLELSRIYSTSLTHSSCFGPRWASSWGQWVATEGPIATFFAADGAWVKFDLPASSTDWVSNPKVAKIRLRQVVAGFEIRDSEGRILHFTKHIGARWLLSRIEDANANWIQFTYSETGALRQVDHHGGYRLTVDATPTQIRRVTLTGNNVEPVDLMRYEYDASGRLIAVIDGSGRPFKYEYDSQSRITRWQDRNATWYEYKYDAKGRCRSAIGPERLYAYQFEYDEQTRTNKVTDSLGNVSTYEYNERMQTIRKRDARGSVTRTAWDEQSHKLEERDGEGRGLNQTFDAQGNLTQIRDTLGRTTTFTYDQRGLLTSMKDAGAKVWTRKYDQNRNLIEAAGPDGAAWKYERDSSGNVVRLVDPLGNARRFGYDARGLMVWADDAAGERFTFARDRQGRVVERTDPLGRSTRFRYNPLGKLAEVNFPDGARIKWEYDAEGNVVRRVNPDGTAYSYAYGPFDLLREITKPGRGKLKLFYDTEARLSRVENELNQTWRYEYNASGQVVREEDFHGRVQRFSYDASGLCTSWINGLGEEIRMVRDAAGQLLERRGGEAARYEYDPTGRVRFAVNSGVEITLERDAYGRVLRERQGDQIVESAYDRRGLRTRRRAVGVESEWEWDVESRPAALTLAGTELLEFTYDAAGSEIERRMRGGVVLRQEYDSMGRITRQSAGDAVTRTYRYNINGDPSEIDDARWGQSKIAYDADGRIAKAERDRGLSEEFRYDLVGNIVTSVQEARAGASTRFYGRDGRLERVGDVRYSWDADGRLVEKRDRQLRWRYEWTPEGRLRSLQLPDGVRWRYEYDAFGRRVLRSGSGGTTKYVWDDAKIAEEVTDGAVTARWIYQPDTFRPVAKQEGGRTYSCVTDQIGTPRELVSTDGSVGWSAQSSIWGEVDDGNGAASCAIRFAGQWADAESGLHYNFHRYYDPEIGQYLSADPIGIVGGTRAYGYVHNPLTWVDPLGLDPSTATHITYVGVKDGKPYVGYASMPGDKAGVDVLRYRYGNFDDFETQPDVVYRGYGLEGKRTARGLEQRVFEDFGGLEKTANLQNPVGPHNPNRDIYLQRADDYRTAHPSDKGVNPKRNGKCG